MSKLCYKGCLASGDAVKVKVNGSTIDEVKPIPFSADLPYILPVLVDLQQNGALGLAFNNMNNEAPQELSRIAEHLLCNGVGRVLATFTTAPYERLNTAAKALNQALNADQNLNTLFSGIFHEGVFISPLRGWRGGHDPAYIMPPDWEKFRRLNELSGNRIKVVNVAPEEPGAMEFIDKAVASGIKVALGHCNPDSAIINEAVSRGATMVTHFANGAAPEIHRFKNPFWGFLDNPKLSLGLVGDGFHLPSEVVRTALRVKGEAACFMVSDANLYSGSAPGLYHRIGGSDCVIESNGFIHVPDQDILAGAWFQNNRSVEFLIEKVGLDFLKAWRLCSEIPAKIGGIDLPEIKVGAEATFVLADYRNKKVNLQQTLFKGKIYKGK